MNYRVESQQGRGGGRPVYLQLYEQLRRDIVDGVYAYGDRLPSKRLTAEEAGCSLVTVEHSYDLLVDEGYVEPKARRGYYVVYREGDYYAEPEERQTAAGNPGGAAEGTAADASARMVAVPGAAESFPYSVYARTVRRVLLERGERIFDRTENQGLAELRHAIASYLARSRGIHTDAELIVIGAGSEYLYGMVAQLFASHRRIAIEDPSYEKIRRVYAAQGMQCELLRMGADGIESRALQEAQAQVLHVTPFHSYPSGITATAGKRAEYIRWALARDGYIVEDDFDSEFTITGKAKDTVYGIAASYGAQGRVVYLNSFNRTIAPSMRIGYMVLPATLRERYLERTGFYACTVPALEQYVLTALIDGGDFERHVNRVRRRIRAAANDSTRE